MRIELTGPAKTKIEQASDRVGMIQVAMMSRLVKCTRFIADEGQFH